MSLEAVRTHRGRILELATRHGARNVRVFGSTVRGEAESHSDIDRLVDVEPGRTLLMADMPDPGLARVAEETGGGYTEIRLGQELGAAFAGVADELHTQYLLGFAPKCDGKVHDINVRVIQGGLKPRARKSCVAPKG